MSADQLVQYLSWTVFVLIFVSTAMRAARHPQRANIDIALFFSVPMAIIAIGIVAVFGLVHAGPLIDAVNTSLILAMGYMLLRIVDDFAIVPAWLMRGVGAVLAILVAGAFVFQPPRPGWLNLLMLLYLVVVLLYAASAFIRESRRSSGVTRRRMRSVAAGSILLVLLFIISSLNLVAPALRDTWQVLADICGLASSICYFLGFTPPRPLRRAWQEPELRAFLSRAASLPRLPDTQAIIRALERGAATSLGANARIGIWNESERALIFPQGDPTYRLDPSEPIPPARAFREQVPVFSANIPHDHPRYAEYSRLVGATTVLAAPITAGDRRLGVLVVYAPRALIFAEDDLALIQLLADQAAVILESRTLIDEATRVRAYEEATRLKEDFLSAAAHDLKTPLTTLVARAQLLERRALRDPAAPTDLASIQLLVHEAQRLKRLVLELLDAARTEQGRLVGVCTEVDLVPLARDICQQQGSERHLCAVEASEPVVGIYDQIRLQQLLENLVENAVKYSPAGGDVRVRIWHEAQQAHLTVTDSGIGIPPEDLPHIFDRFYRANNVDDRRFAGMGLGLFICRGIAEQHGGQIQVSSQPGQGSTFHVMLPLVREGVAVYA
ncbi:MAG: ATP-binding protein [Roseiflexaceae bacterium]